MRVPRSRGAKLFFLGSIYMPSDAKSAVKEMQKTFGEIAVDLQKCTRQGEEALVGDIY